MENNRITCAGNIYRSVSPLETLVTFALCSCFVYNGRRSQCGRCVDGGSEKGKQAKGRRKASSREIRLREGQHCSALKHASQRIVCSITVRIPLPMSSHTFLHYKPHGNQSFFISMSILRDHFIPVEVNLFPFFVRWGNWRNGKVGEGDGRCWCIAVVDSILR